MNTVGSYRCDCDTGYIRNKDGICEVDVVGEISTVLLSCRMISSTNVIAPLHRTSIQLLVHCSSNNWHRSSARRVIVHALLVVASSYTNLPLTPQYSAPSHLPLLPPHRLLRLVAYCGLIAVITLIYSFHRSTLCVIFTIFSVIASILIEVYVNPDTIPDAAKSFLSGL